ncbi:MAG: ribonuclease Z [Muribaculum sp.]|nr:ribonuclease Z [Muribaculum sp.]
MSTFKIHTLGCGSAKPTLRHKPSCTVVNFHESLFMIDCGEGAQESMMRYRLSPSKLRHIFLTHLHGDHVFGLFGLIGTLALHAKGGDLTIHTFEEGKEILSLINDYFNRETSFELRYNILDPHKEQVALETDKLIVRTVPLSHRVNCVGYVFEEKPKERHLRKDMLDFHHIPVSLYKDIKRGADLVKDDGTVIPNGWLTTAPSPSLSYAHLSDTAYMPGLGKKAGPVTLMMHETTYLDEHKSMAAPRGHSTAKDAALTALEADAKWLLTGHYSSRYRDDLGFQTEAEEIFPRVILNNEGLCIDLRKL